MSPEWRSPDNSDNDRMAAVPEGHYPEDHMRRFALAVAAVAFLAPAAGAKIAFTGYGNLVMPADSYIQVRAPASVLGGTPEGNLISKGFRLDAVGLFATTRVNDDVDFLVDLTFRNIGNTVGQTRIQYAYLDAALPWWEMRVQAGRVNLPFNYYNSRRPGRFDRNVF